MSGLDRSYLAEGCRWHAELGYAGPYRPFPLPGDRPHYARDRSFDVQHIKLELSFDLDKRRLFGIVSTTLAPLNDGLSHLELDALDLAITNVTASDGSGLPYKMSDNKLLIDLGAEKMVGESITVVVQYEASPRRGLYFVEPSEAYPNKPFQIWTQGQDEDSKYWFPCYDFPNQKATSEVIVTVPSKYFALSNGRLLDIREGPDLKTFHWSQEVPHSVYLVTLVVGEYVQLKEEVNGVSIEYYVPPGREEDAYRSFGNTPDMVKFFAEKIGVEYPYNKYAQVVVSDFIFGGMENTTATTLTDTTLHDSKAHLDFSSDSLVAHELAHQWFGDLLTCRDWSHAWLNEGFATYFEALYEEYHKGRDEFLYSMRETADTYLEEDRSRYRRPMVTNVYGRPIDLFDRHLYEKGALVLHMLRYVLGDKLFWKAINHYTTKHREGIVVTSDLQRSIEEATGRSLDWFFEQWVYRAGYPQYKVDYTWESETSMARIAVSQTQAIDDTTPLFRMPINIDLVSDDASSFTIEISEKEQVFHFPMKSKPQLVRFDPENWVLKTLEFKRPKEMIIYQLKNDRSSAARIAAANDLANDGSPEAITALREALIGDGFWGVQAECARALGKIRSAQALGVLKEGISVSHPKARRAVVAAMGEFRDEQVTEALAPVLEGDESYFVEAEAAKSVGRSRSARAFDLLSQALTKESHNDVIRAMTFEGLGELKDERAVPLALEYCRYGKHPAARNGAISCLGKLAETSEKQKEVIIDTLIDLINDPWLRAQISAISALESIKADKALPHLEQLAESALDGRVRRRSREAMTRIREGRDRGDDVNKLREDMEKLQDENRRLRDRLDKLEAQVSKDQ